MKTYTIQYSVPKEKIAISDWTERVDFIDASTLSEAREKFIKKMEDRQGIFYILDIFA